MIAFVVLLVLLWMASADGVNTALAIVGGFLGIVAILAGAAVAVHKQFMPREMVENLLNAANREHADIRADVEKALKRTHNLRSTLMAHRLIIERIGTKVGLDPEKWPTSEFDDR